MSSGGVSDTPALHDQLLDEIQSMFEVVRRPPSVGVGRHLAALRAVVELHGPDGRWDPPVCTKCYDDEADGCYQGWPCQTVQAIACALGLSVDAPGCNQARPEPERPSEGMAPRCAGEVSTAIDGDGNGVHRNETAASALGVVIDR